jgi:DNA-binding response OmpR family regulator
MDASPVAVAVVVENDPDIRDLIKAILSQCGYAVHAVSSGIAGVEAVREYKPAIVTVDWGLPDIDGFEAVRRIRLFSDNYVIMLTARSEKAFVRAGLESGADDYITKPFRPRELRTRVEAMPRRAQT